MKSIPIAALLGLMSALAQAEQYQIMIYEAPPELAKRTDAGTTGKAYWDSFAAYGAQLKAAGVLRGGAALYGNREARTVALERGEIRVTASPAAASTAELGGYFVIEAGKLEDAVGWAAKAPSAATGGAVEVRPFYPVPDMMTPRR